VESPSRTFTVTDIKAVDEAGYAEIPDVLFVCVKGYSIPDIIPFLREHSDAETLIVPILNIYGTGAKLQQALPDATVVDGCIYIAAEIKEPGVILQKGDIFRIVFGARKGQALCRKMFLLEQELKAAGIDAVLSDQIERDAFQKYAYVSPMAACGLYYDATAEVFQRAGEERMLLIRCMKEIDALATAMGIPFLVDIEKTNLDILDALVPEASTSMQRDIWAGKPSEIDGLLYEPLRLGEQYGVEMPNYEMIVKVLKEKYGE
jgi:2-dehydropantoate 2-reductase